MRYITDVMCGPRMIAKEVAAVRAVVHIKSDLRPERATRTREEPA